VHCDGLLRTRISSSPTGDTHSGCLSNMVLKKAAVAKLRAVLTFVSPCIDGRNHHPQEPCLSIKGVSLWRIGASPARC
jgi:hypothetical protein